MKWRQRRQWIMFKWNPSIYTHRERHKHTKTCIDTISFIHIYIPSTFHIKIHKLTAITISLSWFIHKPENMSQTAHTTGGFILFYCVSCLHKNVVKHALFFSSIHSIRISLISSRSSIISPFAALQENKCLAFVWLLYGWFLKHTLLV